MTVEEAYKTLKDPKMSKFECNFKVKSKKPGESKPPKYFIDFQKQMLAFANEVMTRFDRIESRIDHLESRIDNLVIKNNLIE